MRGVFRTQTCYLLLLKNQSNSWVESGTRKSQKRNWMLSRKPWSQGAGGSLLIVDIGMSVKEDIR